MVEIEDVQGELSKTIMSEHKPYEHPKRKQAGTVLVAFKAASTRLPTW